MPDEPQLPAPTPESRVDRIERVINALSDFEQDELRAKLGALQMQQTATRLSDKRNLVAIGVHTGICSGLFFGLFMGALMSGFMAMEYGLVAAAGTFVSTFFIAGGLFGLMMGAYFAILMGVLIPRLTKNYTAQRSAMFQMETLDLDLDPATTFKVCKETALVKRGWKADSIDEHNLCIQLLTRITVRSPGELVGIRVEANGDGSRVKIYSKALFTAMDFGKNRLNVVQLAKEIQLNAETHRLLLPH